MFPESQFVFDLELPVGFKPSIGDGEVQEFYLLPIDKVCPNPPVLTSLSFLLDLLQLLPIVFSYF